MCMQWLLTFLNVSWMTFSSVLDVWERCCRNMSDCFNKPDGVIICSGRRALFWIWSQTARCASAVFIYLWSFLGCRPHPRVIFHHSNPECGCTGPSKGQLNGVWKINTINTFTQVLYNVKVLKYFYFMLHLRGKYCLLHYIKCVYMCVFLLIILYYLLQVVFYKDYWRC